MTDSNPAGTPSPEQEPVQSRQQEPDASQPAGDVPEAAENTAQAAEDPGYLTESGEAVGEDGSVAPIIGGLPAVEGSSWDIGAPVDDRGPNLADEQSEQTGASENS
jgi:hypothetical protein